MTEPKLTKEELREDPVLEAAMRAGQFLKEKSTILLIVAGVIVLALLALQFVRRGQARSEQQAAVVVLNGESQYGRGNLTEALNRFKEAYERHGGTSSGKIGMLRAADLQLELGNLEEARRLYDRYLDSGPEGVLRASALRGLAATLDSMGQREDAAGRFEEAAALEGNPLAADDWVSAGNAWLDAGKGEQARKAYENVIRLYPEHPRVREAREMLEMAKVRAGSGS